MDDTMRSQLETAVPSTFLRARTAMADECGDGVIAKRYGKRRLALFSQFIYSSYSTGIDHFTETGSGQTYIGKALKKEGVLSRRLLSALELLLRIAEGGANEVKETPFVRHLNVKTIILPRQAR